MSPVDAATHLRLDLPEWIVFAYLFMLGAVVGSFLNVCIYRIPTKDRFLDQLRSLSSRPSHCPRCKTDIRWFDNIPIFGWLKLRGRCRSCRMWISARYPLIEFFNGCLWVLLYWMEVPGSMGSTLGDSSVYCDLGPQQYPGLGFLSVEWFVLIRFFCHIVLVEALLVASMIDFDLTIIPDGATLPAMIFAVLASTIIGRTHLVPVWFQSPNLEHSFTAVTPEWIHPFLRGEEVPARMTPHPHLHGLAVSVAGLLVGGGIVWAVRLLGAWVLRVEAMGFGDVILMAMIGAFLGWQATVIAFFIAPMCAIAVVAWTYLVNFINRLFGRREPFIRMIPYGPYLSLGALAILLFWQQIFEGTRHFFEMGILLVPVVLIMGVLFAASLLLVQLIKRALGIQNEVEPVDTSWRPADQNWFFKGENVNRHSCRWKTRDWDGQASAHGSIHEERWRNGTGQGNSRSLNAWQNRHR